MEKIPKNVVAYEIIMSYDVKALAEILPGIFEYNGVKEKLAKFSDNTLLILIMQIIDSRLVIADIKEITVNYIKEHLKG
jgi:hypothetical protein